MLALRRCVVQAHNLRPLSSLSQLHAFSRSFAVQTINVPPMGDSISEGTVAELLTPTGAGVNVDDIVARLDTDKVSVDIRSTHAGKVTKWYAKAGETVKVGKPLLDVEVGAAGSVSASKESHPVKQMGSVQSTADKPNADIGEKRAAPMAEGGTISPQSIYPSYPDASHRKPSIHFRHGKRDSAHASGHHAAASTKAQVNVPTGNFAAENEAAAAAWAALPDRYKRRPLKEAQLAIIELGGAANYEAKKKVRAA